MKTGVVDEVLPANFRRLHWHEETLRKRALMPIEGDEVGRILVLCVIGVMVADE